MDGYLLFSGPAADKLPRRILFDLGTLVFSVFWLGLEVHLYFFRAPSIYQIGDYCLLIINRGMHYLKRKLPNVALQILADFGPNQMRPIGIILHKDSSVALDSQKHEQPFKCCFLVRC